MGDCIVADSAKISTRVSPEFSSFVGAGVCRADDLAPDPIVVRFSDVECSVDVGLASIADYARDARIILVIGREMCRRVFGFVPSQGSNWYLPPTLRGLCGALIATDGCGEASDLLRSARSIELLNALFDAISARRLVRTNGGTTLADRDIRLVAQAQLIISEDWRNSLSLQSIAKRCGLSKVKLSQGYRDLFGCTVGQALADERLGNARQLLLQSDLHVATIGYHCGYTDKSSFTRAFARHFGITPTGLRRRERNK